MNSPTHLQRIPILRDQLLVLLDAFASITEPATLSLHDYDGQTTETFIAWALDRNVEVVRSQGLVKVYLDKARRHVIDCYDMRVDMSAVRAALREWRPSDAQEVGP